MFDFDQQTFAAGGFPKRLFLLLFVPVAALIVGGAWYVGQERIEEEMSLTRTSEIGSVVMAVRRLDDELSVPLAQLRTLATESALKQGVDADARAIEAAFASLIAYNNHYDKVRWIDESGRERVRVNNVAGRPVGQSGEQLQQQVDSYYFRDSKSLKPGEVYISPLDLNVEYGKVEKPYKPMLRLVTPVVGADGSRRGILVLNVAAQGLLDAFTNSLVEARDHAMLLNSEGYWLKSPDSADEWGFMFGRDDTLAKRNPAAWKAISAIPSGQVELTDGLWTWSTVYPLKVDDSRATTNIPTWLVAAHLPGEQLALTQKNAWRTVGLYMLALLALYGAIAAWLARAVLGRARAVGAMAKAQAEAAAANRLRQAQERFRLVVEANINGLLVADKTGRIVLANAALAKLFGYTQDELLGQSVDLLLPESARPGHASMMTSYIAEPTARPMGQGRELYGRHRDGRLLPIEVSLSPFTENGETFVDAFVIDIAERKRVEQLHRRIEARLQLMMQNCPVGLMVVDSDGAIEMANPTLERLFGYHTGELYNLPVKRLLPEFSTHQAATLHHASGQGQRKNGDGFPVTLGMVGFVEDGREYVQVTVAEEHR